MSNLPHLYLTQLVENPNNITSVKDLRRFTQAFELEDYPDRNTGIWDEALEQGLNNTDPQFWPLYERNLRVGGPEGVVGVLKNHSLDALILPTMAAATLSARIGGPIVDVPMGHCPSDHEVMPSTRDLVMMRPNIPFGLSFIGLRWSEAKLISLAYTFERLTQARGKVKPYIAPTTELRDVMR
jgi:amidase